MLTGPHQNKVCAAPVYAEATIQLRLKYRSHVAGPPLALVCCLSSCLHSCLLSPWKHLCGHSCWWSVITCSLLSASEAYTMMALSNECTHSTRTPCGCLRNAHSCLRSCLVRAYSSTQVETRSPARQYHCRLTLTSNYPVA